MTFLRHDVTFGGKKEGSKWDALRGPAPPAPVLVECRGDCLGTFDVKELRGGLCVRCRDERRRGGGR